jgi:hypothetical protein
MTSFPFDWQLLPSTDLAAMQLSQTQDTSLGVSMMVLINPDGSCQGPFRAAITGSQIVGRIFPITRLIPKIPQSLASLHISYFCNKDGVEPPANSLAMPWLDLEHLLRERQATTTDADGVTAPNGDLLFSSPSSPPISRGSAQASAGPSAPPPPPHCVSSCKLSRPARDISTNVA